MAQQKLSDETRRALIEAFENTQAFARSLDDTEERIGVAPDPRLKPELGQHIALLARRCSDGQLVNVLRAVDRRVVVSPYTVIAAFQADSMVEPSEDALGLLVRKGVLAEWLDACGDDERVQFMWLYWLLGNPDSLYVAITEERDSHNAQLIVRLVRERLKTRPANEQLGADVALSWLEREETTDEGAARLLGLFGDNVTQSAEVQAALARVGQLTKVARTPDGDSPSGTDSLSGTDSE
jgi:hypothetical protein